MVKQYSGYRSTNSVSRKRRKYYGNGSNRWVGRFNKGLQWGGAAMQALSLARNVASLINVEFKKEAKVISTTIGTAGTFICLSNLAQGQTSSTRNGNSIKGKSVHLRMSCVRDTAGPNAVSVRIILFLDKGSQGLTPATGDLLHAASAYSSLNSNNGKRFRVLADEFFSLSQGSSASNAIAMFRQLNHVIEYGGTGSTVGDITNGHLWLYAISNENTNPPTLNGYSALRFVDN